MLVIFSRAIIIYIFLLIAMRLMGKKQLGELQPFEFAISLIVADLACIPMSDTSIPLSYGLIPIFVLFVLHLIVTKIVHHSIFMRRLINGKPVIVINPEGIDYKMLHRLDMTTNDLLESLRTQGYFSPNEVVYAIVETNGSLTVLPKAKESPVTLGDIGKSVNDKTIPITLITEGKRMRHNMDIAGFTNSMLDRILSYNNLKMKDVLLMMVRDDELFIQPINATAITLSRCEVGV